MGQAVSQDVFHLVAENADDLVALLYLDGRLAYGNAVYRGYLGYLDAEEITFNALHPDDRERIMAICHQVVVTGQPAASEYRLRLADGSYRNVHGKAIAVRDTQQAVCNLLVMGRDITELKRVEEDLRTTKAHAELIVNMAPDAVVSMDQHGLVAHWNPEAERMFGYGAAEAIGRELAELIVPPQYRQAHRDGLARFMRTGEGPVLGKRIEIGAVRADGSELDVELAIAAPTQVGGIFFFSAFIRNITDRKRAEKASVLSDLRFRALYESSRDAIMTLTPTAGFLSGNPATVALFGCADEKEFTSLSPASTSPEFQPDGTPSGEKAGAMMAIALETGTHLFEWMHQRLNGECFWAEVMLTRMDVDGERFLQASVRDINERKRIEAEIHSLNQDLEAKIAARTAELRETTERTRKLIDTANDAVVSIDVDSIVIDWNSEAERMFGWSRNEAMGRKMHHMIVPEAYRAMHEAGLRRYLETGQCTIINKRIQIRALHRDGHEFDIELAIWPVKTGSSYTFSAFARDISDRIRAEKEVQKALEKERELNELKTRFVSMTSHEFRTPLSTILSSSEMLQFYYERLPADERNELFCSVHTAVKRMASMLDDVLLIGKADAERLELSLQQIDLAEVCRRMIDEFRLSIPNNIDIDFIAPEAGEVTMDEQLLRQIVGNLVSNAIKYSPKGGTVTVEAQRSATEVNITVTDQGIGIPADDLPRLFESFHRARNVGNISGTGLGLSIVKKSVERQGGMIAVESQVGHGTRFMVRIPLSA